MSKKIKTYILLTAVVGIWGLIAYKIFSALSPELPKEASNEISVKFNPKASKTVDTFFIETSKRDPFLGTLSTKRKNLPKQKGNTKTSKTPENIPNITYGGIIKKQQSSEQVFVLNINNNQYLLKKGQTADSIKLVRGNAKEVVVRYKNKSLIISME